MSGALTRALRRTIAVVGAVLLLAGTVACTPGGEGTAGTGTDSTGADAAARPVTTEESQVLAAMRFRNYDAGTRAAAFTLAEAGAGLEFTGWFDFAGHRGYGHLGSGPQGDGITGALLVWNPTQAGVRETAAAEAELPPPADGDWSTTPLDAANSRLHALLAVFTSLGSDRPDNPLLLQQSGALWLGTDEIDGTEVTVFAGPPSEEPLAPGATADPADARTRYWVDATGLLLRADIRLGDDSDWTTIVLSPADGVDLSALFAESTP